MTHLPFLPLLLELSLPELSPLSLWSEVEFSCEPCSPLAVVVATATGVTPFATVSFLEINTSITAALLLFEFLDVRPDPDSDTSSIVGGGLSSDLLVLLFGAILFFLNCVSGKSTLELLGEDTGVVSADTDGLHITNPSPETRSGRN
jgi:hypothetical protein